MNRDFVATTAVHGQKAADGADGTVGGLASSGDDRRLLVVVVVRVVVAMARGVVTAALRGQDLMRAQGVIWHGQRG